MRACFLFCNGFRCYSCNTTVCEEDSQTVARCVGKLHAKFASQDRSDKAAEGNLPRESKLLKRPHTAEIPVGYPRGLVNLGNTCFLNSILQVCKRALRFNLVSQVLVHTKPLVHSLLQLDTDGAFTCCLREFVIEVDRTKKSHVSPFGILEVWLPSLVQCSIFR